MKNDNLEAIYPLSPMQEGMLFHCLYAPRSEVYFNQLACTLHGSMDVGAFKAAWQHVVDRHPILRTLFLWEKLDAPRQVVLRRVEAPWTEQDWRQLAPEEQQERLQLWLQADREQGFALSKAPLIRLSLIRLSEEVYHFTLSFHHLLLDGWSFSIVLEEVFACYEALRQGQTISLPRRRPYRDYIAWLQKQDMSRSEAFWRHMLKGFASPTLLGIDQVGDKEPERAEHYHDLRFSLSQKTTAALQELARKQQLTVNTIVQGMWALLLSRYSGETDVLFGTTVSGRPVELAGVESMVGLFINTLSVRVQVSPQAYPLPWLKSLQNQQVEARQYEYSPLVQVQGWSEVARGHALFDSLLVFENYPVNGSSLQGSHLQINNVREAGRTNYPLTLTVMPNAQMHMCISYAGSRFPAESITRMQGHIQTLLEGLVANPNRRLYELPLLTEAEREELLNIRNDTCAPYPAEDCFHTLFEAQVERTPDAVAVLFQDEQLTYRQLNDRADQLARRLVRLGVGPEVRVGICMERSLEMVVGLLGILKAGGAFVPLDPAFPTERMGYMLNDAGARLLLTRQSLLARVSLLRQDGLQVLCLDTEWSLTDEESELERRPVLASNLAYIMYTSGSTGKPKGVPVSHQGFVNYLIWCQDAYTAASGYGAPVQSSIAADAIFPSLFTPLLVGTCVMLLPESYALDGLRAALVQQPGFSLIKITPTQLEVLNQQLPAQPARDWVRTLVVGAEALRADVLEFWRAYVSGTRILNEYGPTETVVGCSLYEVPVDGQRSGAVPIGLPIANTQFYVLDTHMQPVPVGVVGELYIGGDGVARGYLNRPDLTAQVFVPDPFSKQPGARLYKTGDLVRYLAEREANIEFVGRRDEQVKIRGYRVELGEVEAVLAEHEEVDQVVVAAREAQRVNWPGKELVAYVVLRHAHEGAIARLQEYLKQKLPEYMQPSAFVQLERLPLTATGKVDLRALPAPDGVRAGARTDFVMPRDILELQLAQIWEDILQVRPIGVTDNFFALGGHSFLAVGLMAQIQKRFNAKLPLSLLFEGGSIEYLANVLRKQHVPQMRSPLVAVQPRGSQRPFFCVHPAGGDILIYYKLAHHLGVDQPFYGLQDPGIYAEEVSFASIEELAALYIDAMLAVQPEGPYLLGGYSFGGNVAFEMAQQLQQQGREVLLLAIIDGATRVVVDKLKQELDDTTILAGLASDIGSTRKQLQELYDELQALEPDEQLQYVIKVMQLAHIEVEDGTRFLQQEVQRFKFRIQAIRDYKPQPYCGQITLFRSTLVDSLEHLKEVDDQPLDLGWHKLSTRPIDIHVIHNVYHNKLMYEPHVQALAGQLKCCFAKAQAPLVVSHQ